MSGRLRVGVIAGGRSAEHEVSIASAEAVLRAIDRDRFEPYLVYIDRAGRWMLPTGPAPELDGAAPLARLLGAATPAEEVERLRASETLPAAVIGDDALAARTAVRSLGEAIDVAFLLFERHQRPPVDACDARFAVVAVIDYEDPSILNALSDANVRGVVTKPVRPFGILSTLLTARASQRYEARLRQKVAKLEETMRSRRDIEKSVRILMNAQAISEEAAYQMIRREAMQRRQSMAVVASSIISAHAVFESLAIPHRQRIGEI